MTRALGLGLAIAFAAGNAIDPHEVLRRGDPGRLSPLAFRARLRLAHAEDAHDVELPALAPGDALLVAPQRVTLSGSATLSGPVLLHLEAGSGYGSKDLRTELLRLDDGGAWRVVHARVNRRPIVASATVDRLGVFCLVGRG